ncbi:Nn.00g027060.m01.CDS01 [Neocucurbitaria sp. VM-36]
MAPNRDFRVIIGGGGISGLTLANALEKAEIDYILLEARDTIHPQIGASIGLFANGGRIFDQLGCFEAISKETCALHISHSRYANGETFATSDGPVLLENRFNYPVTFLEREIVLRILYENLKDKSRIKLQKRISKVDHNKEEVIVLCKDGTAVSGDVLVGCDGVHSKVRHELWRLSHLQEPDAIDPKDKELLFAEYNCLFGISTRTTGLVDGEMEVNHTPGFSMMVIGGKGKIYWFVFKRMDKICMLKHHPSIPCHDSSIRPAEGYKVPDIPRYTKEDANTFAESIQDAIITPDVKFRDIWRNRVSYTLVPTEEAQFKRWSWGRIACVGDGVHKMTPNMGAGGNAAIETAAALANELKKMRDRAEKGKPSYETIKAHLGDYQKVRESRLSAILTAANGLTRIHALKTLKDKIFAFWILPFAGDLFTDMNCDMVTGSVKLDYLPIPDRSLHGTMPFNPSQGMGQNESKLLRALKAVPFLGISALAIYLMWGVALPPIVERIGEIMEKGVHNNVGKPVFVKPLMNFYGVEFIDSRVRGLSACFASFQFVDLIGNWQSFSFLTDAGIVYAILLIEGARRANVLTVASVPLLLGYNMQFFGIGTLMALYCFAHYIQSPIENFRARDLRLTDMGYTATVLPVLILTHYIPNFGAFLSFIDPETRHKWEWIWQPFPIFTSILQIVLKKTIMPNTVEKDRLHNVNADLPTINFTILSLCAISAGTWLYTIARSPFSMVTLFMPNFAATQTGDEYIRLFLQLDQHFSFGACFIWLLYLFGDMKKAGMVADSWLSIILKGVATMALAGPGVTIGLGWLWRERILATKWHKDAIVPGKAK